MKQLEIRSELQQRIPTECGETDCSNIIILYLTKHQTNSVLMKATVCDAGPALKQHWDNISCLQDISVRATAAISMLYILTRRRK